MKNKVCSLIILLCFVAAAKAQQPFTINGKLGKLTKPAKVMLSYSNDGNYITDSARVVKGAFAFSGKITSFSMARLVLKFPDEDKKPPSMEKQMNADAQEFYIEKGEISVSGDSNLKTAVIRGGKTQADYTLLQSQLQPAKNKMQPLSEKYRQYYQQKNESAQAELRPQLQAIRKEMSAIEDRFIYDHPDSWLSFDMVRDKAVMIEPAVFEPFFNALSDRLKNTKEGKELAAKLVIAKKFDVGQPAIDFTQNNTEGVPVSLSSLKGKYVLIDFWASWCGPCRSENPFVVKAYRKFSNSNFEIIGVSLDEKKEAWLKAIKDDSLPWIHVSDLKGWKNEVAATYLVQAVPQNLLLDKNGIIIAKNLRGEALEEKLQSVIGKTPPKDSEYRIGWRRHNTRAYVDVSVEGRRHCCSRGRCGQSAVCIF